MSAQIPETMLMSDLLKSTGYECPEDLQGRTFAEATAGGDVQTNKAATIDVSAYTEPVVIKPDTDYESMKKATVTLSNIPSGADIESNKAATIDVSTYTEPVEITPTEGKDGMAKATVTLSNIPVAGFKVCAWNYVSGEDTGTQYFNLDKAPSSDIQHYEVSSYGSGYSLDFKQFGGTITKVSDTEFTCEYSGEPIYTFTRDTTKDYVIEG